MQAIRSYIRDLTNRDWARYVWQNRYIIVLTLVVSIMSHTTCFIAGRLMAPAACSPRQIPGSLVADRSGCLVHARQDMPYWQRVLDDGAWR